MLLVAPVRYTPTQSSGCMLAMWVAYWHGCHHLLWPSNGAYGRVDQCTSLLCVADPLLAAIKQATIPSRGLNSGMYYVRASVYAQATRHVCDMMRPLAILVECCLAADYRQRPSFHAVGAQET